MSELSEFVRQEIAGELLALRVMVEEHRREIAKGGPGAERQRQWERIKEQALRVAVLREIREAISE